MFVTPQKQAEQAARLAALGIREEDLEESFIRSSGAGGQNVNKVATCVQLLHRPSGIMVRCQQERSQALNRFLARRLMADKIEEKREGERSRRQMAAEKIRRQKRRRSRRAKEKMVDAKRQHGALKAQRSQRHFE